MHKDDRNAQFLMVNSVILNSYFSILKMCNFKV